MVKGGSPPAMDAAGRDRALEWDVLATALNRWGVLHLAPGRVRRAGGRERRTS